MTQTDPTNPYRVSRRIVRTVRGAMTRQAVCVHENVPAYQAERLLEALGTHHLLVVNGANLRGVLCSCDLQRVPPNSAVRSAMSASPLSIDADASLEEAVFMMDSYDVSCLPARTASGWGVLTRGDLIRHGVGQRLECTACGAHHHVRCSSADGMPWCQSCLTPRWDRDSFTPAYCDLGVAG